MGGLAAPRHRRSHRFVGDKSPAMLRAALNASILLGEGKAIVRITNDRAGHAFPAAGMNSLIVSAGVRDQGGRVLQQTERSFGSMEWIPGCLDFWPFLHVSKIPYGESRDIVFDLPPVHGQVSAEFRYRDWFAVTDRDLVFATIARAF